MSNISDIIEQFILDQIDEFGEISLSRNELANFFKCAPSQINYVLSTRFTSPRGFIVESHRGGGGYIKLIKVDLTKSDYLEKLITNTIQDEISLSDANLLLDGLVDRDLISDNEYSIIMSAISNRSLSNPIKMENKLRANILRNILVNIIRGGVNYVVW